MSRILRWALLAPDIAEAVLVGSLGPAIGLEQLERPLPASWQEQRPRVQSGVAERPAPSS